MLLIAKKDYFLFWLQENLECWYIAAIFGDLSSSDEEEEKDINIMDSGEDDMSRLSFSQQHMSFDSMDSSNVEGQYASTDADNGLFELLYFSIYRNGKREWKKLFQLLVCNESYLWDCVNWNMTLYIIRLNSVFMHILDSVCSKQKVMLNQFISYES